MATYENSLSASYAIDDDTQSRQTTRRFNKHVAERKRRARINTSLDQLKALILGTMNKNPEEFEKMEKADILDLTVKFLQASQRAPKPTVPVVSVQTTVKPVPMIQANYQTGYSEALKQTQRFARTSDMDQDMAARLNAHLARQMARNVSSGVAVTSRGPFKAVKRCEPSARLCRNLKQEFTSRADASSPTNGLKMLSQGLSSLQVCNSQGHPAINHRVKPAFHAINVWRPWEGQVSA